MRKETLLIGFVIVLVLAVYFLGAVRTTGSFSLASEESRNPQSIGDSWLHYNAVIVLAVVVILVLWYYSRKVRKERLEKEWK